VTRHALAALARGTVSVIAGGAIVYVLARYLGWVDPARARRCGVGAHAVDGWGREVQVSGDAPGINRDGVTRLIALALELEHGQGDRGLLLLVDAVLVGIAVMARDRDHATRMLGLAADILIEARDAAEIDAAKRRPC
jgi:hypothetical protein